MTKLVGENDRIFLHNRYDENGEVYKIDWSPIPDTENENDVEYLLARTTLNKVDKLMTMAWNLKNIHLALLPQHKSSNWIFELEAAMRFADELFPPEEEREWRK